MRVRALPLAIAAMAALGAVKMVSLAGKAGWSAAPEAHAHASPPDEARQSAARPAAAQAEPAAANCPPDPGAGPTISAAERETLQELRARRDQLDAREKQVAIKEGVLAAAEKRVADRVKELGDLQARLEALEDARKEREQADWQGLVRTYEAMRPRDAAAIMNGMEMPVLLEVLDRMNDRKAALVLASLPPDRARAATTALAEMRLKASQPAPAEQ
jgi:flagellar motility protein MotE (MotC chaperone)